MTYSNFLNPKLLGDDVRVPIFGGGFRRYVNLDNAATTPPFQRVWDKLAEVMPVYGSIHRGAGFKSLYSTRLFEQALEQIFSFSDGDHNRDVLVLGCNTTSCINHLARRLGLDRESVVIVSELEHSSNLLPWRKHARVIECRASANGIVDLEHLDDLLRKHSTRLVAVSGASNVTGAIVDVHAVATLAHRYGAQVFVDAAQLVAHRKLDRRPSYSTEHLDFVAFAAHKMYAPFGIGVLVGDKQTFVSGWPDSAGGGTVQLIDGEEIMWADIPNREQGGTPNYSGVITLAEACAILTEIGFDNIARHERELISQSKEIFSDIPSLVLHREFFGDSTPVFPFSMRGFHHALVGAFLGTEHAIGVRTGHLCQHALIRRLLNISETERMKTRTDVASGDNRSLYGIVRASCGLGNTIEDLVDLSNALQSLAEDGPKANYTQSLHGEYEVVETPASLSAVF